MTAIYKKGTVVWVFYRENCSIYRLDQTGGLKDLLILSISFNRVLKWRWIFPFFAIILLQQFFGNILRNPLFDQAQATETKWERLRYGCDWKEPIWLQPRAVETRSDHPKSSRDTEGLYQSCIALCYTVRRYHRIWALRRVRKEDLPEINYTYKGERSK